MKKEINAAILILLLSAILPSWAYAQGAGFTQQDRERMIRLEEKFVRLEERFVRVEERLMHVEERLTRVEERLTRVEEGLKSTNLRMEDGFNAVNHRLSDLYGVIYVLISGMLALVGFILWDRRTTLAPVVRKSGEIEERSEKIVSALKEVSTKDSNVAEAMKHAGLL
ncbi:MAG: hypothetical protein HQK96_12760 [Nitrospirae bacterium]|nr:hypothetical protein [Nitrospirota bacterium]